MITPLPTFINERLHRQRPVPHVQGVGGLRQDPSYAQRTFIVQIPAHTKRTLQTGHTRCMPIHNRL